VLHMEEFRSYKMPIYINVKDPPYNAAGDGVTDDTSAIQSAINDALVRRSISRPELIWLES
jgi:hypothetical protein